MRTMQKKWKKTGKECAKHIIEAFGVKLKATLNHSGRVKHAPKAKIRPKPMPYHRSGLDSLEKLLRRAGVTEPRIYHTPTTVEYNITETVGRKLWGFRSYHTKPFAFNGREGNTIKMFDIVLCHRMRNVDRLSLKYKLKEVDSEGNVVSILDVDTDDEIDYAAYLAGAGV